MVQRRFDFDFRTYETRIEMADCFICRIAAGEQPHYREHIIFRDESLIAFLSQPQIQRGYVLVAPTGHRENVITDFSLEEYLYIQAFLHRLGHALRAVLPIERLYLVSLGSRQATVHVHWHVVPLPPGVSLPEQQLNAVMLERAGYLDLSQTEQAELTRDISAALVRTEMSG
jgi:diadenosine tetraphosphate (Ap4A) HIT family hydrolase